MCCLGDVEFVDGEIEQGRLFAICNPHSLSALLAVLAFNRILRSVNSSDLTYGETTRRLLKKFFLVKPDLYEVERF